MAEQIVGVVRKIAFRNDRGFRILEVDPDKASFLLEDQNGIIKVVGELPDVAVGESLRFTGRWEDDRRYGKQFHAKSAVHRLPNTESEIIAYLSSDIVKGVGPDTARRIVAEFGEATLEQLIEDPRVVFKAPILRPGQVDIVLKRWREDHLERFTIAWLQERADFSSADARRVHDTYGDQALSRVKSDAYQLAVDGLLTFNQAGELVERLRLEDKENQKRKAALLYSASEFVRQGHTFAPRRALLTDAGKLLQLIDSSAPSELAPLLEELLAEEKLGEEELLLDYPAKKTRAIYLPDMWDAEEATARMLLKSAGTSSFFGDPADHPNSVIQDSDDLRLNSAQLTAVHRALNYQLSVLTGGPGTGKTVTMKSLINYLHKKVQVRLAAPTGRAADQLAKATDHGASTIHRLLGWDYENNRFLYRAGNPLPVDLLVVDEASMLDLKLFRDLLQALPPHAHLLLVGDTDQLPPVEAGNVLRDIIDCEIAPVTRLEKLFRQDESGSIAKNAQRIRQGQYPISDWDTNRKDGFFIFTLKDARAAAQEIDKLAREKIPRYWGLDSLRDIQVIAPQRKGELGVEKLNKVLQRVLINPRAPKVDLGDQVFYVGDKVMQTTNDYSQGVYNGDIGFIVGINNEEETLRVAFEGRKPAEAPNSGLADFFALPEYNGEVTYSFNAAQSLELAYCITVHKAQGSQYPAVIMPVHGEQSARLMTRTLLYTAITRAQKIVCIVGSEEAVQNAINRDQSHTRHSGLPARLN